MSLFEVLRQQKKELVHQQNAYHDTSDIRIQLDFDDKGATIQIINKQGDFIQPDYAAFSGPQRNLIKSINAIKEKNSFLIDWDNPGNQIYLHDYPHLIPPILSSGLLVDTDRQPVHTATHSDNGHHSYAPSDVTLKVVITASAIKTTERTRKMNGKPKDKGKDNDKVMSPTEPPLPSDLSPQETAVNDNPQSDSGTEPGPGSYSARLVLQPVGEGAGSADGPAFARGQKAYTNFRYIADNYAFLPEERIIMETRPVGPFYSQLQIFNAEEILPQDLSKYLSLLFTYIEGISLDFQDYKLQREVEPLKTRPAIIFEKIDAEQNLTIRIGLNLHNAPIGFLDEYEISHLATLNEMEKKVSISPVAPLDMQHYIAKVAVSLKKHAPKGKKKDSTLMTSDGQRFFIHEHLATPFIYNELSNLIMEYDLIGSEKLKAFKIKVDQPKLDLTLGHNIDFLEGTANLDFEGQKISIMDAILQYDKNRYIRLTDGTHALVNEQYMNRLKRLFKKNKNKKGEIAVSFFDLPAIEEMIEENQRSAHFVHAREVFQGFNKISENAAALPKIQAALRPYQLQGFQWISYLRQHSLGGCLADDMGLGKTIQTIAVLAAAYGDSLAVTAGTEKQLSAKASANMGKKTNSRAKAGKKAGDGTVNFSSADNQQLSQPQQPSIIIMPKSLLFNWQNELKKFAPWLTVYIWYGQNRDIKVAMEHQIIITTYAMFRNDIEIWKDQSFLYGILDESQAIKNLNSQVHRAVLLLRARHRLALSGTPVENNLGELFALFQFLNPALLGSADQFHSDYLYPIQKNNDRDVVAELRRKIYPFILRRLKKDVLTDLPDKQEQTIYVEMNTAQAKYYEQRRLFYKDAIDQQVATKGIKQAQFFIFQAMNELRQIASIPEAKTEGRVASPKLEALMEQLEEAIANDHKILIFVNYLAAIETIGEALDKLDIGFLTMTGSTRDRQGLVDRFQNDPEIRVFIMTLKTGGTGLNLTAADMVFIFDPWWNKAAENQAIDRAHRIGQTSKVQSYKLITMGTIEEKILQLQELKSNLFDDLISSDSSSGSIKSMTEEDIQFIMG